MDFLRRILGKKKPNQAGPLADEYGRAVIDMRDQSERMVEHNMPKRRGAILIGCGFMPTQSQVQAAVREGHIRNADTVTVVEKPSMFAGGQEAYMTYIAAQKKKGWVDPSGLKADELTDVSTGRKMWVVYPTA